MSDIDGILYGTDLFGEPSVPFARGSVSERFGFPPFSILDSRSGEWQDRKRAWTSLGIKSEIGRDASLTYAIPLRKYDGERMEEEYYSEEAQAKNTSIFDPVLTELAYRWWSPRGGLVLDPFAGGSVRGIVASILGRRYWGCDLRADQIAANEEQADEILGATVPITVSAAMLRQRFQVCEPGYIRSTCKGRCCESADGLKVTVHPSEAAKYREKGAEIRDGFFVADENGRCPFKTEEGLCGTHEDKPLGCRFSPFTLNKNDVLIVRNRYRCLGCYSGEGAVPAYRAHRWSLAEIVGEKEADRIDAHLEAGGDDLVVEIPARIHAVLRDNDAAKGTAVGASTRPVWVAGDSAERLADAPEADFVFSCPPYGDLEVYSDDPADLSNMEWDRFREAYRDIVRKSVEALRPDSFAAFVVGDFRDPKGRYRNFPAETISAFLDAGASLYNEAVLVNMVASASMRVNRQFSASRKLAKTHQNVLVFVKGDGRRAADKLGEIE